MANLDTDGTPDKRGMGAGAIASLTGLGVLL